MMHLTRTYATAENAEHTVSRLKSFGFTDEMLHVSKPGPSEPVWSVSVEFPFGMGRTVTDILDRFDPIESGTHYAPGTHYGAQGATSPFHGRPASRDPDLESIARLSKPKPVGAIASLSGPTRSATISHLSAGWELSKVFGIPLLTRSGRTRDWQ